MLKPHFLLLLLFLILSVSINNVLTQSPSAETPDASPADESPADESPVSPGDESPQDETGSGETGSGETGSGGSPSSGLDVSDFSFTFDTGEKQGILAGLIGLVVTLTGICGLFICVCICTAVCCVGIWNYKNPGFAKRQYKRFSQKTAELNNSLLNEDDISINEDPNIGTYNPPDYIPPREYNYK
eukprot:TRINITY_DN88_c0_g1_i1.p1 TRINITY_DN88_c0_g1~~TRINITY_DN88_c0_g1_i1.p1  ORF type:complete len:197 (+),score=82.76 TRINITY_DN88_c0_g1_i1:35-592(+)